MKVVHVCSSIYGGAGKAAYRLHMALRKEGINSVMLTRKDSLEEQFIYKFKRPFLARLLEYLIQPNGRIRYKFFVHKNKNFHALSFPDALYDLSQSDIFKDADIVHLHWVGNMLNYMNFFSNVHVPIVWTLHDMNPFLGIVHSSYDHKQNENNKKFLYLENMALLKKKNAVAQCHSLTIISLCEWMKNISLNSLVFQKREHKIIRNCLSPRWFNHKHKINIKQIYNIPENKKILFFVAQASSQMKGEKTIEYVASHLNDNYYIICAGFLKISNKTNIMNIGYISDREKMIELYSGVDAFLLPSLQDNLPNTMLESLSCGIPVITFPVCGMKDIIKDGKNGIFAKKETAEAFLDAVKCFLSKGVSWSQEQIREDAFSQFSPHQIASQHIDLYKNLTLKSNSHSQKM